jgi:hypothetical protein
MDTPEGRAAAPAYLDRILSTTIPPAGGTPEEEDLRQQVLTVCWVFQVTYS